jgi:hypothetical protein
MEIKTILVLNREKLGRLEGSLLKEERKHLKEGQHGATTKVHLLIDVTHLIKKAIWGTSLHGRLGTSPEDQELIN